MNIAEQPEQPRLQQSAVIRAQVKRARREQADQFVQSGEVDAPLAAQQGMRDLHHAGEPVGQCLGRKAGIGFGPFSIEAGEQRWFHADAVRSERVREAFPRLFIEASRLREQGAPVADSTTSQRRRSAI